MFSRTAYLLLIAVVVASSVPTTYINATAAAASSGGGYIQYLDKFDPEAKCIDGSPGAVYVFPGEDKRSVIFEMQGGGLCPNPELCYKRSLTDLGSSKSYPPTRDDSYVPGIMSRNCTINPNYCKFTVVYLQYCDGLLYAANNTVPVMYENHPLWFKGDTIRRAALKFLTYYSNINKVERIQYCGDSAGGVSTFTHSEHDIEYLLKEIPSLKVAAAVPLSGLFPQSKNVNGVPIGKFLLTSVLKLANVSFSSLNQDCLADKTSLVEKFNCASPVTAYNYSTVPTFVMQSYLDLWQVLCDLTAVLTDNNTAEQCHGASLYANTPCPNADFPSAAPGTFPLAQCTKEQMQPILDYQNIALNEIKTIGGFQKPYNGMMMMSCLTHVAAESFQWWGYRLNGVTMNQAVYNWFNTLPPNAQLKKKYGNNGKKIFSTLGNNPQHSYVDCIRSMSDEKNGYECNPTCVNPVFGSIIIDSEQQQHQQRPAHMKNKHFWDGKSSHPAL